MTHEGTPASRTIAAVVTLGCKVNRIESDEISAVLLGAGIELGDPDDAAVIVVNTCTVTGEADAKARKAVRHALGRPLGPIVVVTGCLAALDAAGLSALSDRVVVERDKRCVARTVARALGVDGCASASAETWQVAWGEDFRARAMLKVQDGCDSYCAYCIVPYARGVPRSVPLAQVVERARALSEAGAAEVVVSGINLGRYYDAGADLADVVAALAHAGVARIRLSSIEPQHLTDRLLDVLGGLPAFCAHLHVPLQSGSDRVLEMMGRSYRAEEFEARIAQARAAIERLAVTTDVIAGFPGETDDDHSHTLDAVERIGFAKLHVFRYSERANTPAASLVQVPPDVRAARAAELRATGEALRADFLRSWAGREAEVLVEKLDGATATGTTREYVRARVASQALAVGDQVSVVLGEGVSEPLPATRGR